MLRNVSSCSSSAITSVKTQHFILYEAPMKKKHPALNRCWMRPKSLSIISDLVAFEYGSDFVFTISISCRTATLDFFFDLAESKVAVFLFSILTSDGVPFCFGKKLVSLTFQPFRLLHVFYIHNQSYKNVTIDFVFMTRSMRSVIICCCCCFSAHRSHFACFSRVRGDDVFAINFGC